MAGLRRAGLGVLFVGALLLGSAASARAAEPTPAVHGAAFVRAAGADDFAPAKEGAAVVAGTSVRAPTDSAVTLTVADGVSLRLAPDTTVTLRSTSWLPAEHPGASPVRALQIVLANGEADLEARDPASALGISLMLPGGRSFALWRGAANVAVRGDDVAIALYEGMAIAGVASKWKALLPGTGILLGPKSVPGTHASPVPPRWVDIASAPVPSFALVRGDERASVGAAWMSALGAASYRVEMAADGRMVGPLTIATTAALSFKTEPLAPGSYAIRVRGVSADGIVGPPSSPKPLRIARLTLPPLAFAAPGGAIVIAASQAVTLDDPRDIEIATASEYDPAAPPRWVPAPSDLTLNGGSRRAIRIRHVPSQVETKLLLARRDLHARISFAPSPARWPGAPVDIVVKIEDASGYLDPGREIPAFDVRVDLDELTLAWKHTGATWTARVPSRPAPGPWVVRVNVADRAGVPIGASLVDVDGPRAENAAFHGDATALQIVR